MLLYQILLFFAQFQFYVPLLLLYLDYPLKFITLQFGLLLQTLFFL